MTTRRGFIVLEVVAASALAAMLLVVCLQLLSGVLAQRRAADRRQYALLELGNVMEQVAARPWSDLTAASLSQERLPPSVEEHLPGAVLAVTLAEPADGSNAKRITASLRFEDDHGQMTKPIVLTTWRYKMPDQPISTDR